MLSFLGHAACAKVLIFRVLSNPCHFPLCTLQSLSDMGYVALEEGSFVRRLPVLPFRAFLNVMKHNLSFAGMLSKDSVI